MKQKIKFYTNLIKEFLLKLVDDGIYTKRTEDVYKQENAFIKKRARILLITALAVFAFISIYVAVLVLRSPFDSKKFVLKGSYENKIKYDLVDRNGNSLAVTVPVSSLYLRPKSIRDKQEVIDVLSTVFNDISKEQATALVNKQSNFVWVKRSITANEDKNLRLKGLPGLHIVKEYSRFYPYGEKSSSIVGLVDIDGKGILGAERSFNKDLMKNDVALSIDIKAQIAMYDILADEYIKNNAKSVFGAIVKVNTGEVIALVSLPTFDPYNRSTISSFNTFNHVTQGVYELGSVQKFISIAAVLEEEKRALDYKIDVSIPIVLDGFVLVDSSYMDRELTIPEVIIHSSNIGTSLLARDLGPVLHKKHLKELGLLDVSPIELQEKGRPIIPQDEVWKELTNMTISYGYGVAATQLNMISALTSIVNGGIYRDLTILKREHAFSTQETRVLSEQVSSYMRAIGRLSVVKGTGKRADIKGIPIGGKTGSSEKLVKGRYDPTKSIGSFIGYFPAYEPEYAIIVSIDEPEKNAHNRWSRGGGTTAAPAVKRIVLALEDILSLKRIEDPVYKVSGSQKDLVDFVKNVKDIVE